MPFRPESSGEEAVKEVFLWVRDRIQRSDALDAHWREGRLLAPAMMDNNLHATDKMHLLWWILDEAGSGCAFAIARSGHLPKLEPGFPTPDAFDTALVYLPDRDLWLDPACQDCAVGQVRPALRGGQALRLDIPNEGPVALPDS